MGAVAPRRNLRDVVILVATIIVLLVISSISNSETGAQLKDTTTQKLRDATQKLRLGSSSNSVANSSAASSNSVQRINATFVTLARNSDIWDIAHSIRQVEDRFNRNYHYDWVFLNDKEFSKEFKKVTSALASGRTRYSTIDREHWGYPAWIDQERAKKAREDMGARESDRHRCRYESGFFFEHPLMLEYEWYWRVEPGIKLFCDIPYDPFKWMADNKKTYSFVVSLSLYEYQATIETLWTSVRRFMDKFSNHIAPNNAMEFISNDGRETYNLCHFWSNFEIASLDFLRSKAYRDFFNFLDHEGGFFYERWSDAPVHSIAASLFLNRDEIHFFDDIAYNHGPYTHCPVSEELRLERKCHCDPGETFDWAGYSCTARWYEVNNMTKPEGAEIEED